MNLYLLEQCSKSFPDAGLSHTTHMVGPKQDPVINRCPFSCLSLASLSFPFPFENHVRDIRINKKAKGEKKQFTTATKICPKQDFNRSAIRTSINQIKDLCQVSICRVNYPTSKYVNEPGRKPQLFPNRKKSY